LDVVLSIPYWYINQFDYNKDISSISIKNKEDPQVLSWLSIVSYRRIQIEILGTIFQIYPKGLPENGDFIRFEAHYFRKKNEDKKNLSETLSEIVDGDNHEDEKSQETRLPFVTAEDLLKKDKEKLESESTVDNNIGNSENNNDRF
jgi:hypothetical protein